MRKFTLLTILALLLQSCATTGPNSSRGIAGLGSVFRRFVEAGIRASDNIAVKTAKQVDELVEQTEKKIIADMKKNPHLYGLGDDVNTNSWKNLGDAEKELGQKYERVLADVLAKADSLLKFTPKAQKAASSTVEEYAGLASKLDFKAVNITKVQYDPKFATHLGKETDARVKYWYDELVSSGVNKTDADVMLKNQLATSKQLKKKILAQKDLGQKEIMRKHASSIMEDSMIIHQKTGKAFLGEGGCAKIDGIDVYGNFSEITYRTMKQVDEADKLGKKLDLEEMQEALIRHHSDVTNRTAKESCFSIRELSTGVSCGKTFAAGLSPKKC
jgi:hypothetical protein